MSENILCGPCGYAEYSIIAEKMCTVCEEGLCGDCEKVHKSIKTTRNHRLISTDDFRQIENISISLTCRDHDKRLELYCKTHDVAVCLGCVPSQHRTCSDVIPLDKAAENAKHSTAMADLEGIFTKTLQNFEQIITDRESALKNYESQNQTITHSINETRARILNKLDDLEGKLLQELNTKHEHFKSEVNKHLNSMKNSKQDLSCLRVQTSQLKLFASDIHIFLGTLQINKAVNKEIDAVKETIKSIQNYEVYLQLDPCITALKNEVDHFGQISEKKTETSVLFKEVKVDQSQIQLRIPVTKRIDKIRLQLDKRFCMKQESVSTGCTILPNNNMLIANCCQKSVLQEYSEDGRYICDIPCSRKPFDLTVIDYDRIAVTHGPCSSENIEIVNMNNRTIEKEVNLNSCCYGISYQDNKLVIIIIEGIVITDIAGNVLKLFKVDCDSYIATTKDRIYFTAKHCQTVHCISMAGDKIWVRKEISLIDPLDIVVDEHQNVFVVDPYSNSLIVIQHDGSSSRKLLSGRKGLIKPRSLYYNKDKKELLVCDNNGGALYNFR